MSNSRSKKILQQLLAPDSSITPEASSKSIVNAPDSSELLNELDTYRFDLDIESIDQFIILGDSVNNNININCSNNNFNNCDTVEPFAFESNVENYYNNNTTTILSNDDYCVVTPDIEKSLEVDVVMPVSITNDNNTDSNLGNDDNVNKYYN